LREANPGSTPKLRRGTVAADTGGRTANPGRRMGVGPATTRLLAALSGLITLFLVGANSTALASARELAPPTTTSAYAYDTGALLAQWTSRNISLAAVPSGLAQRTQASSEGGPARLRGFGVAAETEAGGLSEAFHYTGSQNVASIESKGLLKGSYATPDGGLSPLQAQIDLALPPNRGLPGALVRIDVAGLRGAGYEIPKVTQVGRSFNMPGGGYEMQFPYSIPPEFLKVVG